jgi:phage terminase large subunit-like protein
LVHAFSGLLDHFGRHVATEVDFDHDGLDQLEGEMMAFSREWDRAVDGSPNRLDAMVWGLTRLSKIITHIPIA